MTSDLQSAVLEPSASRAPVVTVASTAAKIRETARHDPAAALQRLHAATAQRALVRFGGEARADAAHISGWSRPGLHDAAASQGPGLTALRDGGRLSILGRQSFGVTGTDGPILVSVREPGGGGHLVLIGRGPHLHHDEPIFDRAGFRQRWIDAASPVAAEVVASVPARLVDAVALETAREEELLHAALDLGLVEGFWEVAQAHITTRTRPWQGQSLAKTTDDPHLVRRAGEFLAAIHAAEGLFAEAAAALAEETADATDAVAAARGFLLATGRRVISGTIELLGAGATSDRYGFDLYWRDLTAHAVAHGPFWPPEQIGDGLIRSAKNEILS